MKEETSMKEYCTSLVRCREIFCAGPTPVGLADRVFHLASGLQKTETQVRKKKKKKKRSRAI